VWLPALGVLAAGVALAAYISSEKVLHRFDPAAIPSSIGRQVRWRARVTESGVLLHEDGTGRYFLEVPLRESSGEVLPAGHDVLVTGRIANYRSPPVPGLPEPLVNIAGHQFRDLGPSRSAPSPAAGPASAGSTQPTMTIHVTARSGTWTFRYPDGRETSELRLPLTQAIRFVVTSSDGRVHGWPGSPLGVGGVSALWGGRETEFVSTFRKLGRDRIRCSEFCGPLHSQCGADLIVEPDAEFQQWLSSPASDIEPGPVSKSS
jgi:heme/copper-type cytochrome/quinol oxidase subunit 2